MLERTSSLPDARQWLLKRNNRTSNVIKNEILQLYGHAIQRQIVVDTQHCSSFGLNADGTTDICGTEQFSCCLQFVDSKLKTQNMFFGLYYAPDTTAETLFLCVKVITCLWNV